MAEADSATLTTSQTVVTEQEPSTSPNLRLKLRKPKTNRQVKWTTDTVDNEHMNKKKSKCCCIYEKPRMFGESSSEDEDDECRSCRGHKDKCFRTDRDSHDHGGQGPSSGDGCDGGQQAN